MSTETTSSKTQSDSFDTTKQKADNQADDVISANAVDADTIDLSTTLDSSDKAADSATDQSLADAFVFSAVEDSSNQTIDTSTVDAKAAKSISLNHGYAVKGYVMDKGSMRDINEVDNLKSSVTDPSKLEAIIKAGKSSFGFWNSSFILSGSLDPKSLGFLLPVLVDKSGVVGNNWIPVKVDYENSRELLNPKQFDKYKGSVSNQQEGYFDKNKVKITNTNLNKGAKINTDDSVNQAKDSSILGKIGSFAANNSRFVRGMLQNKVDAKDPKDLAINTGAEDSTELEGTMGKMASAFKVIAGTYLTNFFPNTSFTLLDTNITGVGTFVDYSGMFELIKGQDAVKVTASFNVETHDKNDVIYLGSSIEPISGLEIGSEYLKVRLLNTGDLFHSDSDQFKLKLDASNWAFSIVGAEFPVNTAGSFYYDLNSQGFYGDFSTLQLGLNLFGVESVFKFIGLGLVDNTIKVNEITSELSEFLLFDSLNIGPTTLNLLDIDSSNMRVIGNSDLDVSAPINFGGIELSSFGGKVSFDYQKGVKEVGISNGKASIKVGDFEGNIEDFSYSSKDNLLKAGFIRVNGKIYDKDISFVINDFQIASQNLVTFTHAEGSLKELTFLEGKIKVKDVLLTGSKTADEISFTASSAIEAERLALADDSLAVDNLSGKVELSTDLTESTLTLIEVNGIASLLEFSASVNNLSYNNEEDSLSASTISFNGKLAEGDFTASITNLSYSKDGIGFSSGSGSLNNQALLNDKIKLEEVIITVTKEGELLKLNGSSNIIAEEIGVGPVMLNGMSGLAEFSNSKAEGTNIVVSNFGMNATVFDTVFSIEKLNYDYKSKKLSVEKVTALSSILEENVSLSILNLTYQNSLIGFTSITGTLSNLLLLEGKVQISDINITASEDLATLSGSAAIASSDLGNDNIKLNNLAGNITVTKTADDSLVSLVDGSFSLTALGFTGSGTGVAYNHTSKIFTAESAQIKGPVFGNEVTLTATKLKASKAGIDFTSINGLLPAMELDFFSLGKVSISSIPIGIEKNGEDVKLTITSSMSSTLNSVDLIIAKIEGATAVINFSYNSQVKGLDYSFGEVSAGDVKFNFWGNDNIGIAKQVTYDKVKNAFKADIATINLNAPTSISSSVLIFTAKNIELSKRIFDYEKAEAQWTGGEVNFDPFKLNAPSSIVIDKATDSVLISDFGADFTSDLIGASGKASFRISNTGQLTAESISATLKTPTVQLLPEKIPGIWPFELRIDAPIVPGLSGTFALGAKGNAEVKVAGTIAYANNELIVRVDAMPSAALEIYLKAALTAGIPLLAEIQAYLKGSAKAAAMADSKISYSRTYNLVDNKMVHTKSAGDYSLNFDVSMALDAGINAKVLFWERNLYEINVKTWQLGTTSFTNTFASFDRNELTPSTMAPKGFLESGKTPKIPVSTKPKGYTQGLIEIGEKFNMDLLNSDTAPSEADLNKKISEIKAESSRKSKDLLGKFKISNEERTFSPENLLARNNDVSDGLISNLIKFRSDFETNIKKGFTSGSTDADFDLAAYQAKLKEFETGFSDIIDEVYARDISLFNYKVADELYARIDTLTYTDLVGTDKQPKITNGIDFINQIESNAESKMAAFKLYADNNRMANLSKIDEVKSMHFEQLFMAEGITDSENVNITGPDFISKDASSIDLDSEDINLIKTKKSLLGGIYNQQKKNTAVKEKEYSSKNGMKIFMLNGRRAIGPVGKNKAYLELINKRNLLEAELKELERKTSDAEIQLAFDKKWLEPKSREFIWKKEKKERRNQKVANKKIEVYTNKKDLLAEESKLNYCVFEYENLSRTWTTDFDKFIPIIEKADNMKELTSIKESLMEVFYGA